MEEKQVGQGVQQLRAIEVRQGKQVEEVERQRQSGNVAAVKMVSKGDSRLRREY